jgi:Holliday junction DNA helicase RuvA
MIGYISGKVVAKINQKIIIKTATGIGYLVQVSHLKNFLVNEHIEIFIFEVSKENQQDLYGFEYIEDRKWIEKLVKVSGVGPKMAANILYTLGSQRVMSAIAQSDHQTLSSVKGLGAKTAKKIVLDLKTDLEDLSILEQDKINGVADDFIDTLQNLGYKKAEIVKVIKKMYADKMWNENIELVQLVKIGLKYLAK